MQFIDKKISMPKIYHVPTLLFNIHPIDWQVHYIEPMFQYLVMKVFGMNDAQKIDCVAITIRLYLNTLMLF